MKKSAIIWIVALAGAAVICWLAFSHRGSSEDPASSAVATSPANPATAKSGRPIESSPPPQAWEYKTVEQEMSEADLRQSMQDWSREGWAVLSISKPLPQPDGTVFRKVELRKARR